MKRTQQEEEQAREKHIGKRWQMSIKKKNHLLQQTKTFLETENFLRCSEGEKKKSFTFTLSSNITGIF